MPLMTTAEMNKQTGWTPRQRNHLRRLMKAGAVIAFCNTDRHGRPANGGPRTREWEVRAGLVQQIRGPLKIYTAAGLHGTYEPHKWAGSRVWVAGWLGEIRTDDGDKIFIEYDFTPTNGVFKNKTKNRL